MPSSDLSLTLLNAAMSPTVRSIFAVRPRPGPSRCWTCGAPLIPHETILAPVPAVDPVFERLLRISCLITRRHPGPPTRTLEPVAASSIVCGPLTSTVSDGGTQFPDSRSPLALLRPVESWGCIDSDRALSKTTWADSFQIRPSK